MKSAMVGSIGLVGLAVSSCVAAQDIQYDRAYIQKEQIFNESLAKTRRCMNVGAQAMLRNGARSASQIAGFTIPTCSVFLRKYMVDDLSRPQAEVDAFINALALDELYRIPGVQQPAQSDAPNSATSAQNEPRAAVGRPANSPGKLKVFPRQLENARAFELGRLPSDVDAPQVQRRDQLGLPREFGHQMDDQRHR